MSEEIKFKVGDKVKVIKSNNTEEWFDVDKQNIFGVVEKVRCVGVPHYRISIAGYEGVHENGWFAFKDEHLELLTEAKESKIYNPLVAQEGGGHYKNRGIQPIEYSEANNLGACQHSVVKYITRHQDKNGIEDLSKIIHFTLLEAYFKYGEEGSTELRNKVLKLLGVNE